MNIIAALKERKKQVLVNRIKGYIQEKHDMGEYSLFESKEFQKLLDKNLSSLEDEIRIRRKLDMHYHIPLELGYDIDKILEDKEYIYGVRASSLGFEYATDDYEEIKKEKIENAEIYANGNQAQGTYNISEEYPNPSLNFTRFTQWIYFFNRLRDNDTIFIYRFPKGTVTDDLVLLDKNNLSGLFVKGSFGNNYNPDNIVKLVTYSKNFKETGTEVTFEDSTGIFLKQDERKII